MLAKDSQLTPLEARKRLLVARCNLERARLALELSGLANFASVAAEAASFFSPKRAGWGAALKWIRILALIFR